MLVPALALITTLIAADPQLEQNPVYQRLQEKGVSVGEETFVPLPPPVMADGASAAQQQKIMTEIAGSDSSLRRFLRDSVVASHVLRMDDVKQVGETTVKSVDFYFVVYSDLKTLQDKDVLEKLLGGGAKSAEEEGQQGDGKTLTAEDLKERNIPPIDEDHEGYGYGSYRLLDNVMLHMVGRSFYSQTDKSIIAAAAIDPRFTGDQKFPNIWQPITGKGTDETIGSPQPYDAAGMYAKITELADPKGAVFVEAHIIYAEPQAWFGGANLLGSKMPVIVQDQVRDFRRELKRIERDR